ncbi:MAG: hypothetical protein JNK89_05510, partial [Saprospiraceae bacterium]|nr:hypothetical protein [Saprospiraceae bacterium]
RIERAESGFHDLEMWLHDTLRRGLATALSEDPDFFEHIATRLADASLRGLSRNFRLLAALPAGAPEWAGQVTATLAEAALALSAFKRRHQIPPDLVPDLEAYIGIALKKEQVLATGTPAHDRWLVMGALETTVEASLRQRRSWLLGCESGQFALLLEYAHGGLDFLPGFKTGRCVQGPLVFYPSAYPLRALVASDLTPVETPAETPAGFSSLEAMATAQAAALGRQPWLEQFPAMLQSVRPYPTRSGFHLADAAGKSMALENQAAAGWQLLAQSGGHPLAVFGEWRRSGFLALSMLTPEGWAPLSAG